MDYPADQLADAIGLTDAVAEMVEGALEHATDIATEIESISAANERQSRQVDTIAAEVSKLANADAAGDAAGAADAD